MIKTNADLYSHPLFNQIHLKIETLQIKMLFSEIMHWIWCGLPGGFVIGDARTGKSTAIEMLVNKFYNRQNIPIPTKTVVIPPRDQNTIKATYYCLNTAFGLGVSNRNTTDVLAEHVINYLVELAFTNPAKMVVLFVDEFQRLKPTQLQVFAEIYDNLRLAKVNICTIFIANRQESSLLLDIIARDNNSHIRGRFFNRKHEFEGFTNVEQIEYVLSQLDVLQFPSSNGPTYTEYFLKDAYQLGFRYKSLAKPMWRVYNEHFRMKTGLSSWPAQYLFQTIVCILTDYLFKEGIDGFDDQMVADAIVNSAIMPDLVSIQ